MSKKGHAKVTTLEKDLERLAMALYTIRENDAARIQNRTSSVPWRHADINMKRGYLAMADELRSNLLEVVLRNGSEGDASGAAWIKTG